LAGRVLPGERARGTLCQNVQGEQEKKLAAHAISHGRGHLGKGRRGGSTGSLDGRLVHRSEYMCAHMSIRNRVADALVNPRT